MDQVAIVLYVLGLGLSHGLQQPNVRRMIALQDELVAMGPPPAGATPAGRHPRSSGSRRGRPRIVGTLLQLDLVVILMVGGGAHASDPDRPLRRRPRTITT